MKKKATVESYYQMSVENAAKYSKEHNTGNDEYHYHNGRTHAYGNILDYDFDRVEADIEAEIEKLANQSA